MKKIKKIAALLLAAVMLASTAACSSDKSWCAKNDSLTVPVGSYIYYLYSAYASASSKVPDSTKAVLDQKIDSKDAATWIREKALNSAKSLFVIDKKMKDLKLTLTDAEKSTIKTSTDNFWNSYGSTLEEYGVAKSSYELAAAEYGTKYQKVFNAVYGKGGSKAVSDNELKSFFEKNYTDFSYVLCKLYKTDSSGNYSASFSDTEKKKAEAQFNDYASKIKAGTMTLQQAADAYKSADPDISVQTETVDLKTNTQGYPDDLVKILDGMKAGETKAAEISDGYLYLLATKNDITKKTEEQMKTDSGRSGLLADYKGQEFSDEISKEADSISGVTVNEKAVNSYNPSMFVTEE
ncbi:peptidyl-prolyl cis-trans isomerase [Caproiciproducens sp. NJN-50]|uniref:peptidyl-prolyl cis-trans isomerase n=1 Tax=Acutalibacteraceae TaxID=3082771 RepID=UPI000FFE0477|nr:MULTISPECIES: peptidyl-prolyl cis-trans isomerase [Acutalibacteraceae]QAT51003.1 peptidyl-prolyl cis-trans isomerase [Caproiciproducens sp. NJN-50]